MLGRVTERDARGIEAYASQLGLAPGEVRSWFVERFGARFAEEAIAAAGGAWTEDALGLRERSLVVVAALITQGGVESRLRGHVRWAVEHGCTRAELEAVATLLAVYAGYPRASTGLEVVREVLDEFESDAAH
jgi:alkylhydroperoxidase/carboxymuconolactone decarboxylase family protein YurZ